MRLTTTLFEPAAPGSKRTRAELRLHGAIPWPEDATAESLVKLPARLTDVDAGSYGVAGLPFRSAATLDLLAPDELDDEQLSSVLTQRREALLQSPGSWCGGERVWVRFNPRGDPVPNQLDELIGSAKARLMPRRKQTLLRLREMVLQDFRGIEHLTFVPSAAQTTVLVGVNGSGKTTLLDAAGRLLYQLDAQLHDDLPSSSLLRDDDIRNGQASTRLSIKAIVGTEAEIWDIGRERGRDVESARLNGKMVGLGSVIRRASYAPVIVHYGVNRAVQRISLRNDTSEGASPDGTSDFRHFFEWFREREDLENETRIHDSAHRDPQLEAVRRAIHTLVPEFENLRVQRAVVRMLVNKGESTLYVDQLSDGEKCLLAMAGDIARRLAMANPLADAPLLGGGVILIDEIELHLHPGWQRRVVPALERTFPNCQFILTTHSPAVLGHVDPASVFILQPAAGGIEIVHPDASRGSDVSRILEDVLGTPARPAEFMDKLDRLYQRLADGDIASARSLYAELAATLGTLNPALVKADVLLRRRESALR